MDVIQLVAVGVLRGAGRPVDIYKTMITSHYVIGLPLASVLAFSSLSLGLVGLWLGKSAHSPGKPCDEAKTSCACLGHLISLTVVTSRLLWIVRSIDWAEGARQAQEHIKLSSERVALLTESAIEP